MGRCVWALRIGALLMGLRTESNLPVRLSALEAILPPREALTRSANREAAIITAAIITEKTDPRGRGLSAGEPVLRQRDSAVAL